MVYGVKDKHLLL